MKNIFIGIIAILSLFATGLAYWECYLNYPYNWQIVTYCVWNSNDNWWNYNYWWVYNYNWVYYNGYDNYYPTNNYNTNYNNSYNNYNSYNNNYDNQSNVPYRTDEENYYIMLYNNWFEWPGESKEENYIDVNVIWKDTELEKIDAINIKGFSFNNSAYSSKYNSSITFINGLKEELKIRYFQDKMSFNKVNDSTASMKNLVYSLNEQYTNLKKYEQSWNKFYKELAAWNVTDIKARYTKLKNILKSSY